MTFISIAGLVIEISHPKATDYDDRPIVTMPRPTECMSRRYCLESHMLLTPVVRLTFEEHSNRIFRGGAVNPRDMQNIGLIVVEAKTLTARLDN
jgi:hypothetical protein